MPSHPHRLFTAWRLKGDLGDAVRLLTEVADWPSWWGSVIRSVTAEPEEESYVIRSRGLLPLGLRWRLKVVERGLPYRWVTEVSGDLQGRGIWHLRQAGAVIEVEHEWQTRGLPFLASVTQASHRWLLSQAQEALTAELQRIGSSPFMSPSADPPAKPARLRPIQ